MTACILRAVLRDHHQPRARVRRGLVAPRLQRGERGLLERLFRSIDAAAEAQEAPEDRAALPTHGFFDERGHVRHSSRISNAPCTMKRVSAAHRTASSMLAMRTNKRPP